MEKPPRPFSKADKRMSEAPAKSEPRPPILRKRNVIATEEELMEKAFGKPKRVINPKLNQD